MLYVYIIIIGIVCVTLALPHLKYYLENNFKDFECWQLKFHCIRTVDAVYSESIATTPKLS